MAKRFFYFLFKTHESNEKIANDSTRVRKAFLCLRRLTPIQPKRLRGCTGKRNGCIRNEKNRQRDISYENDPDDDPRPEKQRDQEMKNMIRSLSSIKKKSRIQNVRREI